MCLGIPVEIIELKKSGMAVACAGGVTREVSVQLLGDVKEGDYVLLHAGFAIQKIDVKEAKETLKLLREIANEVFR